MKVVINTDYGGFCLSDHAKKLYRKYAHQGAPDCVIGRCFRQPEDRCCPHLVRVVEELGRNAGEEYARLKVVEVPDDVQWIIQEYDGSEWVAEVHRTWC
jgi:hypothetical protein